MMNDIAFTMSEKDSYDYVYVDANNMVHLLCPLAGGETIGLDNTCKSTKELKQFFGKDNNPDVNKKSAIAVLERYRSDLKADIALLTTLTSHDSELQKKIERLKQIETYLKGVRDVAGQIDFRDGGSDYGRYPREINVLLAQRTNCLPILLSPESPDNYLNASGYVFSVGRSSPDVGHALRFAFRGLTLTEATVKDTILQEIATRFGSVERKVDDGYVSEIKVFLKTRIKELTGKDVDLDRLQTAVQGFESGVSSEYITTILAVDELQPKEMARNILLASISDDFWTGLSPSHFRDAASLRSEDARVEKLSILTQFFLAEVNVFCFAENKSKKNFGELLDTNTSGIGDLLVYAARNALKNNQDVEKSLINVINQNHDIFGLSGPINDEEAAKIIKRFNIEYATVKDGPHMDEFNLFLPEHMGAFANHKNRLSFHFSHLVPSDNGFFQQHLAAFSERSNNNLSHRNLISKDLKFTSEQLRKMRIEDILLKDSAGKSMLDLIIENGDFDTFRVFCAKGVDLAKISRNAMEGALKLAIENEDIEIVIKLQDTGICNIDFDPAATLFDKILLKADKATLITISSYISKSNLTDQQKESSHNKLNEELSKRKPISWTARILSYLASFKLTAWIATFFLPKPSSENDTEFYRKPVPVTVVPVTSTVIEPQRLSSDSILDALHARPAAIKEDKKSEEVKQVPVPAPVPISNTETTLDAPSNQIRI